MTVRTIFYIISIVGLLAVTIGYQFFESSIYLLFILIPYIIIGIHDVFSTKHTILRNYPVIGHLRYLLEKISPEIQQYFIETYESGRPYSRETRSLIYRRAKGVDDTIAFGTQREITQAGYEFSYHSILPVEVPESTARIIVGGKDCTQPYEASILNISAMSFGALSPNAILALSKGAKEGNFAHNTGEGGISPYHLEGGGHLIWQIGTGNFGCRNKDGTFNEKDFEEKATHKNVKMIELKISQGAKPSHGGILPGAKVNKEIANIRGLEVGEDAISPPTHSAFSTPIGLLEHIAKLRKLSGGKPVGFKLCIGIRREFMAICKAILETGIMPDFITVDGAEGGTGAAPVVFTNRLGTPVNEAVSFVHNCLVGIDKREDIRIIASGKVATGYDLITKTAFGADMCNAARAMMFALGCIQSLSCNTNRCPTGVATQDKSRWKTLDVEDKYMRVARFQKATVHSFLEVLGAMGLSKPRDLKPELIRHYENNAINITYAEIYPMLKKGELLSKNISPAFKKNWELAKAESFN
jgi:glutamate synthase domain-containing protein 2